MFSLKGSALRAAYSIERIVHFTSGIDADFARQVNDFINTYLSALDELAK